MSEQPYLCSALDVFAAAVYWHIAEPSLEASKLAAYIGRRAEASGCTEDQIAFTGQQANRDAHAGFKPELAGDSFAEFRGRYGR